MPALSNAKHERFAQELAKGATADEAYVSAGYAKNRHNAARLYRDERVQARVAEILERAAVRAEITVASVTERLMRLADKAEDLGDAAGLQAARACAMDAAKLHGLVVDKSKVESTNRTAIISDRPLTEDEWAAQVEAHTSH